MDREMRKEKRLQRRESRRKEREKRRIQRKKTKELRRQQRRGMWKRVSLRRNMRISVTFALVFALAALLSSSYAVFKQPLTAEEEVAVCRYSHSGWFNYVVYLRNNTVYDNATMLHPGEGLIFRRITDHINGSFNYRFSCDSPVNLSGSYSVVAVIQTDIWKKEFVVVAETFFAGNNKNMSFNVDFPIDYPFFEGVVETIDEETGVNAGNPTLLIKCVVHVMGETGDGVFNDVFSPFLSIPLGAGIVEINGDLHQSKPGSLKKTIKVFQQSVVEQQNNLMLSTSVVFFILILFLMLTKNAAMEERMEKILKQIHKKYGEWIVETEKPLGFNEIRVVALKSFEDLVKTSEELGKPIIHYTSLDAGGHMFCVIDNGIQYEYGLVDEIK